MLWSQGEEGWDLHREKKFAIEFLRIKIPEMYRYSGPTVTCR